MGLVAAQLPLPGAVGSEGNVMGCEAQPREEAHTILAGRVRHGLQG